uniref:Insulin-like growth factor 2 mRNA binding protein 2b n=1 Tax=Astyanax mexicanus TaxID=7994 RepID=A0A8B9JWM0_ASTMX
MNKLYVGNLSPSVTVEDLKRLFGESELPVADQVLLKSGYAFVDFPDQKWAIKAIETLSGKAELHGKVIEVDYSVPKKLRSRKIQIRNIPPHLQWEVLDSLLSQYGSVENVEQVNADSDTAVVNVTYASKEEAKEAIEKLTGHSLENHSFSVSYILDVEGGGGSQAQRATPRGGRGPREPDSMHPGAMGGLQGPRHGHHEFPLRLLVPTQFVGAIIGKEGLTIKNITKQTQSKVDIHRKENAGAAEKPITIHSSPEGCSQACRMILEVMEKEANDTKTLLHHSANARRKAQRLSSDTSAHRRSLVLISITLWNDEGRERHLLYPPRESKTNCLQTNMIPGLNLSALGIFSSSLPVLSPPGGPRGVAPLPTTYNPFMGHTSALGGLFGAPPTLPLQQTVNALVHHILWTNYCVYFSLFICISISLPLSLPLLQVNELQNLTSAEVIVPRDQTPDENDEVFVKIIGHFFASQTAQRKIREIIQQVKQQEQKNQQGAPTPSQHTK